MLAFNQREHTRTRLVGINQLLQVVGQIKLDSCRAESGLEISYGSLFVATGDQGCRHHTTHHTCTEYMFDIFDNHNSYIFTVN